MSALDFFAAHPVFTRDEFARTRVGSPRTVDSLLRQHVERGTLIFRARSVGTVITLEVQALSHTL